MIHTTYFTMINTEDGKMSTIITTMLMDNPMNSQMMSVKKVSVKSLGMIYMMTNLRSCMALMQKYKTSLKMNQYNPKYHKSRKILQRIWLSYSTIKKTNHFELILKYWIYNLMSLSQALNNYSLHTKKKWRDYLMYSMTKMKKVWGTQAILSWEI